MHGRYAGTHEWVKATRGGSWTREGLQVKDVVSATCTRVEVIGIESGGRDGAFVKVVICREVVNRKRRRKERGERKEEKKGNASHKRTK